MGHRKIVAAKNSSATPKFDRRWKVAAGSFVGSLFAGIVVGWFLWHDWPRLHAFGSVLGMVAFTTGVIAFYYAVQAAIEAADAHSTSQRVMRDLVRTGLLVDKLHGYRAAFEQHITKLLDPMARDAQLGPLLGARFLISTPVYGYHVLGTPFLTRFRAGLEAVERDAKIEDLPPGGC